MMIKLHQTEISFKLVRQKTCNNLQIVDQLIKTAIFILMRPPKEGDAVKLVDQF